MENQNKNQKEIEILYNKTQVNIIGAGLAGCECAYILARNGIKVNLYEMKPIKKSPAHESSNFAELVCSNSLKSEEITNACGLLKKEMSMLGSIFVEAAYSSRVPAGQALAVDRDNFSTYITDKIKNQKNIHIISQEVEDIGDLAGITVVATGPLTADTLFANLKNMLGDNELYFYDAVAPIVETGSIDMKVAYIKDRYADGEVGDYINLPMTKPQYDVFYNELINANQAKRHEFDKLVLFEGCMPIEEMAKRGEKTLVFGPLKPVGLDNPRTGESMYAVVQLRAENEEKTSYNLVGFQTSLSFSEQKRVFSLIPGLENAVFERYGVMHRNTYINGGELLDSKFCLKANNNIYFAGQISGVEGYVESAASGLMVAYNILNRIYDQENIQIKNENENENENENQEENENDKKMIEFTEETMLGSLAKHVSTKSKKFDPMNANFGIIRPLDYRIKDKKEKYTKLAEISISKIKEIKEKINERGIVS